MLNATAKSVTAQTTYEVPDNKILIEDATSPKRIRPVTITVTEKDGGIQTFAFAGPRQLPGTRGDARDSGSRVIGLNEVDLEDSAEKLINEVFELHLRSTVHVLTEDETREVMARLSA